MTQAQLSLFPPQHYLVLDVETRLSAQDVGGWHMTGLMGVSVAVLYDSRDDSYTAYTQDDVPKLAQALFSGPLVVGFNILKFDYGVLAPHAPACNFRKLPSLDMLVKIHAELGHRVSLDSLASATLGAKKSADGLLALRWWKEQRLDLIEEYCRKDVELTRSLYLHGREKGFLLYTGKTGSVGRVRTDWR